MRITLISAPQDCTVFNSPLRSFQPLSLMRISALLKQQNHQVTLSDHNAEIISEEQMLNASTAAELAVFSTAPVDRWQCPVPDAGTFLRLVKKLNELENLKWIIICGPHAAVFPEQFLISEKIIAVLGEPEYTTAELVHLISEGIDFNQVEGICYKSGNQTVKNNKKSKSYFCQLPLPDYSCVKMERYSYDFLPGRFCLVEASRGCGNCCFFCFRDMYPSQFIPEDEEKLMENLKKLWKMGIRSLFFIDLDFCADKKRAEKICKRISRETPGFSFAIQTKIEHLDTKLIRTLADSGCRLIETGAETSDEKLLVKLKKNESEEHFSRKIRICRRSGIETALFFIYGLPGSSESPEGMSGKALRLKPDYASFKPFVNYRKYLRGLKDPDFNKNLRICRKITLKYYLHPLVIFRLLRKNPSGIFQKFKKSFLPLFFSKKN